MVVAVLLSGCALHAATSGGIAATNSPQAGNPGYSSATVAVQFSERERRLIRNYYRNYRKNPPPGLAKREQLPPGLVKRKTLPPGLQARGLPSALEAQLSRLPAAYTRIVIGADVAIIERATRVVIDVVYGVAA